MGTKSIRTVLENTGILLVIVWFVIITIIASMLYIVSMGTNPNGETCDYYNWIGGNLYQGIWNQKPCIFSLEYDIMIYSQFFLLYILYDYIRKRVVGFKPKMNWCITEVSIWFGLNWGYVLWLTATDYGILNWTMGIMSFVGTLLFFVPIVLLAMGVYWLRKFEK